MDKEKFILEKRCIPIEGEINKKLFDDVRKFVTQLYDKDQQKPIDFLIDSEGGLTRSGTLIYDFCKGYPGTLRSTVHGFCGSSTNNILLACKPENRFATTHSHFMIHNGFFHPKISLSENIEEQLKEIQKDIAYFKESVKNILVTETKLKGDELEHLLYNSDRYRMDFGAKKAIEYGFISKIIEPGEKLPYF